MLQRLIAHSSQLGVHHDLLEPFLQLLSSQLAHKPVLVHGVIPLQVQDFAFAFVELHEVPVSLFLQPVEVPLNGSMILWWISCSSQVCIVCKLAKGALCPIVQIINQDVK